MPVTFTTTDQVGYITLDNPPANSYDLTVMTAFSEAVDQAIASDVKSVVINSASEKFFSAGADVKKFLDGDVAANMKMIATSQAAFKRMAAASQIFIAHINGHALGGGLEITLAADIRLANTGKYRLGTPEVTLGLLPGNGGTQRLPRLVGASRGLELLITGRTFSPQDALDWGLVSELYEPAEAKQKVHDYAARFAAGPPLALAAIKRCVHQGCEQPLADGLGLEAQLVEKLFQSADGNEGLHAFVEKRKPEFHGK